MGVTIHTVTDMLLDTMLLDTDTILESDLLMLSQKASHGTDMVLDMDMVLVMLVTEDLDTMDTTLESDLLMLKLSQKASHGTDTVDTDTAAMVLVMVDTMVGENKLSKSCYNNESKFQKNFF